jgi:long-chain fatty acid transport protein
MLWDLGETVSLAASYQPKITMSKLDDYSDLFADHGNMDIPSDLKAGITFRPNAGLALNFDIEKIWYSDVPSVNNPFSNLFACPTAGAGGTDLSSCLGGKNGAGFGWEDMTVYKIGAQWAASEDWTWRAGYSTADQPIPESEVVFNILAPGVIEKHATIGFTHALPSSNEYSMSLMYAFNKKINGINPLDPSQTISMDMDQWELEFSFGWR